MIALSPATAAPSAYDQAAAATRSAYSAKVAKCKPLVPAARRACIKSARAEAQGSLGRTHAEALGGAKAAYASAAARCRAMNHGDRRRCMKTARAERAMALGRAEEIRSAPLALGLN